jgi:hypothetical protein
MPVNPVVQNWLHSALPQVKVKPDWLSACCDHVETHHPGLRGPELIQKVSQHLYNSNLADSTTSGCLPDDFAGVQTTVIATQKGGLLVQIESIFDIGVAALSISDAHKQRLEDAKMGTAARVVGNIDDDDAEQRKDPSKYPRGMLKLKLSDGFSLIDAIEYKRISDLSMDDTMLGCKLLLKNVKALHGVLLLEPANCTVKGSSYSLLVSSLQSAFPQPAASQKRMTTRITSLTTRFGRGWGGFPAESRRVGLGKSGLHHSRRRLHRYQSSKTQRKSMRCQHNPFEHPRRLLANLRHLLEHI